MVLKVWFDFVVFLVGEGFGGLLFGFVWFDFVVFVWGFVWMLFGEGFPGFGVSSFWGGFWSLFGFALLVLFFVCILVFLWFALLAGLCSCLGYCSGLFIYICFGASEK